MIEIADPLHVDACPDCGEPPDSGSLDPWRPGPCPTCDRAAQLGCSDRCSAWADHDEPHGLG